MKFSAAVILASAAAVSATTIRSESAKRALLSKSRRLEENANQEENQYSFLTNYKLKLIGCSTGEVWTNPQDGVSEYSSVVYRLCPADSCFDDDAKGCKKGYGDFVVGINTFVQAWLQDKRDDMQNGDDNVKIEEYGECKEYKADKNGNNNNNGNDNSYYVGPACFGSTISLGFFSDYTCTTKPDGISFEDISNGWSLPYSSSSLITTKCEGCSGYDDNGNFEISEMCTGLYDSAGKCETGMSFVSYNGADESGCSYIQTLLPKKSGSAGAAFGWTVFALVIVGGAAYGYTKWWVHKKQGSGLSSDGVLN